MASPRTGVAELGEQGGAPLLGEPGGLPILAEDNPFLALATGGRGRKILLVEQDTGETWDGISDRPGHWATHGWTARADDSLKPNQFYEPRIKGDFHIKRSLVNGNVMRGRSVPDSATLSLLNTDGGLSGLAALDLQGKSFVAKIVSDGWLLSEAQVLFSGLAEEVAPDSNGRQVQVTTAGLERALQQPLQSDRYRGMGQAVLLPGTTNTRIHFAANASLIPTSKFLVEAYASLAASHSQVLASFGSVTTGNLALVQNTDGTFTVSARNVSGTRYSATSSTSLPSDWEGQVSGGLDGTSLQVYIDGVPDGAPVAFSGTLQTTLLDLYWGSDSTGGWFDGWVTNLRLWVDVDRSAAVIKKTALRPLASGDDEGLALYCTTHEATGTETWDDVRRLKGTLEGGAGWVSTRTGTEDLAGKAKPTAWGPVPHLRPVEVDPTNRLYQAHFRQMKAVDGVYEGGEKLVPQFSFTADIRTNYYAAAGGKMYIELADPFNPSATPSQDFRSFVAGQTITVTGSTLLPSPSDLTVLDLDEEDGRWIRVAETLIEGTDPTGGATFATKAGTHDYTIDLTWGGFALIHAPTKAITCRVRGDALGGYVDTVPEIMARMAELVGAEATPAPSFAEVAAAYPYQAFYATSLDDEVVSEIFDKLAISLGATWGTTVSSRELDIEVLTPPEPETDPSLFLDLTPVEILAIRRLATVPAVYQSQGMYRKNFAVLSLDDLVDLVSQDTSIRGRAWRGFITQDHQVAEEPIGAVASGTLTLDTFDCYLRKKADAASVTSLQYQCYGVPREIFEVTVKLQPYLFSFRRTKVRITHPRWASTAAGKWFRIVAMEGGSRRVTLTLWG